MKDLVKGTRRTSKERWIKVRNVPFWNAEGKRGQIEVEDRFGAEREGLLQGKEHSGRKKRGDTKEEEVEEVKTDIEEKLKYMLKGLLGRRGVKSSNKGEKEVKEKREMKIEQGVEEVRNEIPCEGHDEELGMHEVQPNLETMVGIKEIIEEISEELEQGQSKEKHEEPMGGHDEREHKKGEELVECEVQLGLNFMVGMMVIEVSEPNVVRELSTCDVDDGNDDEVQKVVKEDERGSKEFAKTKKVDDEDGCDGDSLEVSHEEMHGMNVLEEKQVDGVNDRGKSHRTDGLGVYARNEPFWNAEGKRGQIGGEDGFGVEREGLLQGKEHSGRKKRGDAKVWQVQTPSDERPVRAIE
eukprot:Gb_30634 [translate_table: standard]